MNQKRLMLQNALRYRDNIIINMRILVFTPKEKKLKLAVRAAKLHEYMKKNGISTIFLPDFNFKKISLSTLLNYIKLLFFIATKRDSDLVLFENERSVKLLSLLKKLKFLIALDNRDNRALQRSAYRVDDSPEKIAVIEKQLAGNIEICDYVFTVSQTLKEIYPQKYHNRIYVVENASDPFLFVYTGLPERLRVGFISGIAPGRGIELLIKAMELVKKRVTEAELSIAGTPHKETVQYYLDLKKRYESDWMSFHDDIYYSTNASQFIRECYLTVIPHPDHVYYHAALPVKLFDSLACGRPVVATNCKETAEILVKYKCGLVSDFTPEDLAEKISQLLLNREEASEMGKNGRRLIEEIYNWDNMAKKIIKIIGEKS